MIITLNGNKTELTGISTIEQLLELYYLKRKCIIIEINKQIITKEMDVNLSEGDVVELIRIVGGG